MMNISWFTICMVLFLAAGILTIIGYKLDFDYAVVHVAKKQVTTSAGDGNDEKRVNEVVQPTNVDPAAMNDAWSLVDNNGERVTPSEDWGTNANQLHAMTSIVSSGTPNQVVSKPGVPPDAHRWHSELPLYTKIKTGLDLPRILRNHSDLVGETVEVCVFTHVDRGASLWTSLNQFGSNKYRYRILHMTECQYQGTCTLPMSRMHPNCAPGSPVIGLVQWKKMLTASEYQEEMRITRAELEHQDWDISVLISDEFCEAPPSISDFRFYHDGRRQQDAAYLPIGPTSEFGRVEANQIKLGTERPFLFNFVGVVDPTRSSRQTLFTMLDKDFPLGAFHPIKWLKNIRPYLPYLHLIPKWTDQMGTRGYLTPEAYKMVLLNSTFTLCPLGHNPESYRVYEAIEAGSIPIIALDHMYRVHSCAHAFAPLILSCAPLVFLNAWWDLKPFLLTLTPEKIVRMQADVMSWYSNWMRQKATEFEAVLDRRVEERRRKVLRQGTGS